MTADGGLQRFTVTEVGAPPDLAVRHRGKHDTKRRILWPAAEKWVCGVIGKYWEYDGGNKTIKKKKVLGMPAQRHGHAMKGESGQYLGHKAKTGMFDGDACSKYVFWLTQFPGCDGRPSIDALQ